LIGFILAYFVKENHKNLYNACLKWEKPNKASQKTGRCMPEMWKTEQGKQKNRTTHAWNGK